MGEEFVLMIYDTSSAVFRSFMRALSSFELQLLDVALFRRSGFGTVGEELCLVKPIGGRDGVWLCMNTLGALAVVDLGR